MRVVVTSRRFPEVDVYDDIVAEYGGELVYGNCQTEEEAIECCAGADVIIGGFVPITERVMDAAGDLELIMVHAAGYDAVDVRTATYRGIPVSNAPGYSPHDVASHAMTLALTAAHGVSSKDRRLRSEPGWKRDAIQPLHEKTLGIVGFGHIGRKVVPKARGFDMDVIAYDPYLAADVFELMEVESVSFESLLERSDCISVHTPLTKITHRMFGRAEFERMKESAVFVNAARGPVVDESALVWALESGQIRAAGLDVFEREPPEDSPLLDLDNAVLTPHVAGSTQTAEENVIDLVRAELRRVLEGKPPQNIVNPSVNQYEGEQVTRPGEGR